MKINNHIIAEAGAYVTDYLEKYLSKDFCYHDCIHTYFVVNAVGMLCDANKLNKSDKRILLIAAWFHDVGYTKNIDEHEKQGALIAEAFLKKKNVNNKEIQQVKNCILATLYPQQPKNILEQIICDADMLHVSESNFMERLELLRKEWGATLNKSFSDKEWIDLNIEFLNKHTFHTEYCKELFNKPKSKNLETLAIRCEQLAPVSNINTREKTITGGIKNNKHKKQHRLERGVQTLFKITSSNHMKLSRMADYKAHTLLSINSIIISVVLSLLVKNLDKMPYLILPTILLLSTCLVTIVFAVLTTNPKVSKGVFTEEQIRNREVNLLFFGNFHKMSWEAYEWGIQEIMHDKDYLYKSMTMDIYFLGKVLAVKYRYLNIGFKVFLFGMICAVLAFGASLAFT
jgi:predicted metal-dependent HD superfamily phosphohydrolase